ncbi:MAG: lysylphosphatidylglycerol synthase transmembrane domain-containing protein [Patescibacteria group bacterium]
MRKTAKRNIIALIITIILVSILISQINLNDVYLIIKNLKPVYFIFAFLIFILSNIFRAIRFRFLLQKPIGFLSLFKITSIGIMVNQILPARAGELSYPYLFKKTHNISLEEGFSLLISTRIFDLLVIVILFLLSLFLVIRDGIVKVKILILGIIALVITILIALILLFAGNWILRQIRKIAGKKLNYKFVKSFYNGLGKIINNLSAIKSPKLFFPLILFSVFIWLTMYFLNYILVRSLGLEFGFFENVFVATFCLITSVLPIHGFIGLGTTEGSWAIGMLLLGYSKGIAITSGFGIHIINLFFSLIVAVFSFLTIKFKDKI